VGHTIAPCCSQQGAVGVVGAAAWAMGGAPEAGLELLTAAIRTTSTEASTNTAKTHVSPVRQRRLGTAPCTWMYMMVSASVSLSARDRLRSIPRAGLGAGAGILGMLPQGRGVKVQPPTPTTHSPVHSSGRTNKQYTETLR
jgi:hypothetical protein